MFELTTSVDALGLQSLADVEGLHRRRYRSYRKNVCLVSLNHSLNNVGILNILNGFGGL